MKAAKLSYCPKEEKPCIRWIEKYVKDCLCNLSDEISFGFGIASLMCWAVAEIPQIITNFNNKSSDGVSLAFLGTWIVGDVFNLVGCILEQATLPTQLYTAWLYTTVTIILALQCTYYNHFLPCLRKRRKTEAKEDKDETDSPKSKFEDGRKSASHVPVEVPQKHRRDFYYMSARSLASSDSSPMNKSYIKARSGPPALEHDSDSSSEEEESFLPYFNKPVIVSQPQNIPRLVGYGTFAAASANLPFLTRALTDTSGSIFTGRRFMKERAFQESAYGQWLGWLMTAIYMGGRIPQIWLSIKRGSVEGLNPLMFVFALIANATYVGSILVRTTEWKMIKANMPWLLDAIGCVLLDLFIILQYIFYKYLKQKKSQHCEEEYCGDYVEATKPSSH